MNTKFTRAEEDILVEEKAKDQSWERITTLLKKPPKILKKKWKELVQKARQENSRNPQKEKPEFDNEFLEEVHNAMLESNSCQEAAEKLGVKKAWLQQGLQAKNLSSSPKVWKAKYPQSPADRPDPAVVRASISSARLFLQVNTPTTTEKLKVLLRQLQRMSIHYPTECTGTINRIQKTLEERTLTTTTWKTKILPQNQPKTHAAAVG